MSHLLCIQKSLGWTLEVSNHSNPYSKANGFCMVLPSPFLENTEKLKQFDGSQLLPTGKTMLIWDGKLIISHWDLSCKILFDPIPSHSNPCTLPKIWEDKLPLMLLSLCTEVYMLFLADGPSMLSQGLLTDYITHGEWERKGDGYI